MSSGDDIKDKNMALVVVDMQNKYAMGPLFGFSRQILPVINGAIEAFREAERPVIFIRMDAPSHEWEEPVEDPDGFIEGLDIREDDIIVPKVEMSAFNNTDLAATIGRVGADSILVCGLVARFCVLSTYYGAFDHHLSPFLLKDGTASFNPIHTPMVEGICRTIEVGDLAVNPAFAHLR